MSLSYQKKNIVLARNLRKHATPEENHLWYDFCPNTKFASKGKKRLMTLLRIFTVTRQS